MSRKKLLLFTFIFASCSWNLSSQEDQEYINQISLNEQFEYLIKESEQYKRYHVVPTNWLDLVKNNVLDSMSVTKEKTAIQYNLVSDQKAEISKLQKKIAELQIANKKVNSTYLFGLETKKNTHLIITYSLFLLLVGSLILLFERNRKSKKLNAEIKIELKELEKEFENHRRVAIEREQKVRRQLQDEINKSK